MTPTALVLTDADPFDLPEWLGTRDVVWWADSGLRSGHLVLGHLAEPTVPGELPCDVLAVDQVFPTPATDAEGRLNAHRAWAHGEIYLGWSNGRLILAVPGTSITAETVLDALGRLARAVGGDPRRFAATLRVGESASQTRR